MTNPTDTATGGESPAAVFAELFRSGSKLTPSDVAERLGDANVAAVKEAMHKVFMGGLLHMEVIAAEWHYGVTALGRKIVRSVGLDGVTDPIIDAEYHDALCWRDRRKW